MLSHAQKYNDAAAVEIFLGDHFLLEPRRNYTKTVVFDLDETIGHFKQFYCLYQIISKYTEKPVSQPSFNAILDLYPEFFRVGIFSIFEMLYRKKRQRTIGGIYIYTNNKCDGDWVKRIVSYIESKICTGEPLFDDLILAFKIRDQIVEPRRTMETKTYSDFVRCIMFPEDDVEVCFIDNTEYTRMSENKVYYILPSPYYHSLKNSEIMRRFFHLPFLSFADKKRVETIFKLTCSEVSSRHPAQTMEATRKIMYYIREFLLIRKYVVPPTHKTRKVRPAERRQTAKRRKLNKK
jgi:hypothetical protein